MINRVVIVGRITKKPELKTIDNNLCVTSFHIAIDNFKGASGQKTTSFIPIKVWNNQAINVCKYTTTGSLVGVDGFLKQNKYTKEDGSINNTIEVIANSVTFLDSRNKDNLSLSDKDKENIDKNEEKAVISGENNDKIDQNSNSNDNSDDDDLIFDSDELPF